MNSNNISKNRTQLVRRTVLMPYVLGIKCKNGVMLSADTKFTVDGGADDKFGDKITGEITGVLTGFAGNREPFEDLRMQLRLYAVEIGSKNERITADQLWLRIMDIIRATNQRYGSRFNFDLLVGISTDNGAIIRYFYQDGGSEDVDRYKAIGTGSPYGLIYLKTHWYKDITMDEAADLAYFIIRYIERFKLDLTVGTGEDFPRPLIRFIPEKPSSNDLTNCQPTVDDYKRYETNALTRLNNVEKSLKSDYNLTSKF